MTIKILGIDPGLRSTGFGIIQKQNNKYHYIVSGCIKSDKNQQNQNLSQRIGTIFDGISQIIQLNDILIAIIINLILTSFTQKRQ